MFRLLCPTFLVLQGHGVSDVDEVSEIKKLLQNEINLRKAAEEELGKLRGQLRLFTESGVWFLTLN